MFKLGVVGMLMLSVVSAKDTAPSQRLAEASTVFSEIMAASDKSIPDELLNNAYCIVIVPSLKKGAVIVGAKYGKGFISCRKANGNRGWSAPGSVRVEGGSVGFQIGGEETDVVLLVMNQRGADRLLASKFTIGADGDVAAGPVGRSASAATDAKMTAQILSWSRSRGVFAGISLQGATLREDLTDNQTMYGRKLTNRAIVKGTIAPPADAKPLIAMLNRYSPREKH